MPWVYLVRAGSQNETLGDRRAEDGAAFFVAEEVEIGILVIKQTVEDQMVRGVHERCLATLVTPGVDVRAHLEKNVHCARIVFSASEGENRPTEPGRYLGLRVTQAELGIAIAEELQQGMTNRTGGPSVQGV